MKQKKIKGFTLIEMLLTVAIVSAMAAISFPIYQSFQTRNDLDVATTSVVQSLRRAQMLSQNVEGDSSWGVDMRSGAITIFKGTNFAGRDHNYDEIFDVPMAIVFSPAMEIYFSKLAGIPSTTGTITLSSNLTTNETRTVTINSKGMVSF